MSGRICRGNRRRESFSIGFDATNNQDDGGENMGPYQIVEKYTKDWNNLSPEEKKRLSDQSLEGFHTGEAGDVHSSIDGLPGNYNAFINNRLKADKERKF